MKKKRGPASDRISAMVLGVSICSEQKGKYNGPLFARKKNNYLERILIFVCVVFAVLAVWREGREKTYTFVTSFWKQSSKAERNLASEPEDTTSTKLSQ